MQWWIVKYWMSIVYCDQLSYIWQKKEKCFEQSAVSPVLCGCRFDDNFLCANILWNLWCSFIYVGEKRMWQTKSSACMLVKMTAWKFICCVRLFKVKERPHNISFVSDNWIKNIIEKWKSQGNFFKSRIIIILRIQRMQQPHADFLKNIFSLTLTYVKILINSFVLLTMKATTWNFH